MQARPAGSLRAAKQSKAAFVAIASPGVLRHSLVAKFEQVTGGSESSEPRPSEAEIAREIASWKRSGFDPQPYLERLAIPALWLFGGADRNVPPVQSAAYCARSSATGGRTGRSSSTPAPDTASSTPRQPTRALLDRGKPGIRRHVRPPPELLAAGPPPLERPALRAFLSKVRGLPSTARRTLEHLAVIVPRDAGIGRDAMGDYGWQTRDDGGSFWRASEGSAMQRAAAAATIGFTALMARPGGTGGRGSSGRCGVGPTRTRI